MSVIPAAPPSNAARHLDALLSFETDCRDVHLPHTHIDREARTAWLEGTLFVVYCAGPHSNGADLAAARVARLGCPVKTMIGGIAGWREEGFDFAAG